MRLLTEEQIRVVSVKAPARLHFGFLDMHGGLGRQFGSLGLCLSDIVTHLTVEKSDDLIVHSASDQRVTDYVRKALDVLKIQSGAEVTIHNAIPEHAGLGSGTQLALATAIAIAKLYGNQTPIREIAILMGRGSRSGIGIGAFILGGFLIDGGKRQVNQAPPIVVHCNFPQAWRVLLVFDNDIQGINGYAEQAMFGELPLMPAEVSAKICRLVLMQLLPALAEQDCGQFGVAITQIQSMLGQHFSTVQRGYYISKQVEHCLHWMLDHRATGIGQSSWGPTGFAIYPNEDTAKQALEEAHKNWHTEKNLDFYLCTAHNASAEIQVNEQPI